MSLPPGAVPYRILDFRTTEIALRNALRIIRRIMKTGHVFKIATKAACSAMAPLILTALSAPLETSLLVSFKAIHRNHSLQGSAKEAAQTLLYN